MSKIIVRRQEYANNGTHANEIEAVVQQNLIANTLSSATDIAASVGLVKSETDAIKESLSTYPSMTFFGGYGKYYKTYQTSIDAAVNMVTPTSDNDGYFTIDNAGSISGYGNRQFIFGWVNSAKNYGWCFVCAFGTMACGRRNGASTFTLTQLS